MTREIKFRGKRIDTGEWVYGNLLQDSGLCFIGKNIEVFKEAPFNECLVNPDTVGQYTGLKDRNGKEIYEGDILLHEERYNLGLFKDYIKVEWEDAGYIATVLNNESKGLVQPLEYCTDYPVCGNIHDNPELLEDKK